MNNNKTGKTTTDYKPKLHFSLFSHLPRYLPAALCMCSEYNQPENRFTGFHVYTQ